MYFLKASLSCHCLLHLVSDRPAAIGVEVKSIDDTSNFDDFPNEDLNLPAGGE